jgi:hypothetical protein
MGSVHGAVPVVAGTVGYQEVKLAFEAQREHQATYFSDEESPR